MSKEKLNNNDVLHSFLVENAEYEGYFELPRLKTSTLIPEKVITFSKSRRQVSSKLTSFCSQW